MEEAAAVHFLRDAFILLGFALGFVLLFRRFGLGATLGYLVAGAVVGPQVLGLVGDAEEMSGVGELGIVLLLFIVGLELNPTRLWRLKREIFGLGLAQVALCGLALTGVILLFTGFSPAASLALGLPLALSSTAQVLPMLQSAGRLRTPFGERASCWSKDMSNYSYHLTAVHQKLDERIRREMKRPRPDSILLLRLKKLRLSVKDRLAALRLRSRQPA